jgi:hypothetical protein
MALVLLDTVPVMSTMENGSVESDKVTESCTLKLVIPTLEVGTMD